MNDYQINSFDLQKQNILTYENHLLKKRNKCLQDQNKRLLQQLANQNIIVHSYFSVNQKLKHLQDFKQNIEILVKTKTNQIFDIFVGQNLFQKTKQTLEDSLRQKKVISFIEKVFQEYLTLLKRKKQNQKQNEDVLKQKIEQITNRNTKKIDILKQKVMKNNVQKQLYVVRLQTKYMKTQKFCCILNDLSQKYKKLLFLTKNQNLQTQDLYQICKNYLEYSLLNVKMQNCRLNLKQIQQQWKNGLNQKVCYHKVQQINQQLNEHLIIKQHLKKQINQQTNNLNEKLRQGREQLKNFR